MRKLSPTCSLRYLYLESVTWTENIKATSLSSRLKIPYFDKIIKGVKWFCFKFKLHFLNTYFQIACRLLLVPICGHWVPEIQCTVQESSNKQTSTYFSFSKIVSHARWTRNMATSTRALQELFSLLDFILSDFVNHHIITWSEKGKIQSY